MNNATRPSFLRRAASVAAVSGIAMTLLLGAGQSAGAQSDEPECEADRSDHLLGGLLTGPLTAVSDLLPFTIAGEQYPVCD